MLSQLLLVGNDGERLTLRAGFKKEDDKPFLLEALSTDLMRLPVFLVDETTSSVEWSPGWGSSYFATAFTREEQQRYESGSGAGTGPVIEALILYDETKSSEVRSWRYPEPDIGFGTGWNILCEFSALRDETQYQEGEGIMSLLRIAAENGDEDSFVRVVQLLDWSQRSVADFAEVVRLALKAGAHLTARNLAIKGARRYPHSDSLQKMKRLLAPPQVLRNNLPPVPSLRANREWMAAHADQYKGQWIALQDGRLLASASTARELQVQVKDPKAVLITKVV